MIGAHSTTHARSNGAEPADIWKARRFIEQSFEDEISLSKVAKVVNVSPNHLSEKFKQVTGVNFVNYVAQIRFEKALSLLHNLDLRVSEIAFAVGFQSLSQFNRVFKKLSGKSPTEYRAASHLRTVGPTAASVPGRCRNDGDLSFRVREDDDWERDKLQA